MVDPEAPMAVRSRTPWKLTARVSPPRAGKMWSTLYLDYVSRLSHALFASIGELHAIAQAKVFAAWSPFFERDGRRSRSGAGGTNVLTGRDSAPTECGKHLVTL
jgi:hypothetical protein